MSHESDDAHGPHADDVPGSLADDLPAPLADDVPASLADNASLPLADEASLPVADDAPLPLADDFWGPLRSLTDARIGLPRSGPVVSTSALLAFRLAHAQARDAVADELDVQALDAAVTAVLVDVFGNDVVPVQHYCTAAPDKRTYLMRPDLGRQLASRSSASSGADAQQAGDQRTGDLCIVIGDGLSAQAVQRHAPALLKALMPLLRDEGWAFSPIAVVKHARVAVGDVIAHASQAQCVLVLIGERPGLSSPDSMGAYMTWAPAVGGPDANRNCVSNIRPAGFAPALAARKLAYLLGQMRAQGMSGVRLKDDMPVRLDQ
ncbi:MAG: ethanolamine ammonia-lyase subunit EutC [Comamonadaceae bacterium]|nr:MAG: ethanolamine ammonia-lyase subunit EutC [Comamonadaceae bacterium]